MTDGRFDLIARTILDQAPRAAAGGSDGGKWLAGMSNRRSFGSVGLDHYLTRRNARLSMQDSPLARAMVERMADTSAGLCLRLEMAPEVGVLGVSRERAAAWARDVSLRFHLWASDKRQHRSESLTFYQYIRLYSYWQQRDNDMFTRLYYDPDPTLQNPLQFEGLDPDQIRGNAFTSVYGFQGGDDGITRDSRGREIAYKIWEKQTDGSFKDVEVPARGASGRLHMLHGFRQEYAGQGRGYTRLAHAVQEFENITDFSAATIKKAINQSSIFAFVAPDKNEDASNPLEDMINTVSTAGPAAQLFGSNPQEVPGIPVVPTVDPTGLAAFGRVQEATLSDPGGLFVANLRKGETIEFPANSAPADAFDKFVDSFAGYVSASTGTPLEVVLMKFGQNYSASRATLLLFFRIASGWAVEMDADLLTPVVEMWLAGEIAAGRIIASGWSDPRLRAAWLQHSWNGEGMLDIDPLKTANANRLNAEIGATNLDAVSQAVSGTRAADNLEINRKLFHNFPMAPWIRTGGQQQSDPKTVGLLAQLIDLLENGG